MSRFDADDDCEPLAVFRRWMAAAVGDEPNDPDATALATATRDGVPSVRMVLMKQLDERGFHFYTNAESRKGRELLENPRASMCFYWKTQRRQVRVDGIVHGLPAKDSDAYFRSRSRMSQLGALASSQSRPLASRAELDSAVKALAALYPVDVPRPEYWRGYLLEPHRIEFWQAGMDRLHDRIVFERAGNEWRKTRLYP